MGELVLTNVDVWYGSVHALRSASMRVSNGECVGILGSNGAGKTTLLNAVSRLVPYRGEVRLDGRLVIGRPEEVVRLGIVHVLEGRHIFPELTVWENLQLARFGFRKPDFNRRFDDVLQFFPALQPKLKDRAGGLSGGQQQILAIARGLLCAPSVLILDEPSLGLAPVVVDQLADLIPALRKEWETTVLISEQFVQLVLAVAERVYVLQGGRVVHSGPANAALLSDAVLTSYLGDSAVAAREALSG